MTVLSAHPIRTWVCATIATVGLMLSVTGPAAAVEQNAGCLSCHETTEQFDLAPVDRDTVCTSCHTPGLLGTHPYHQSGSNCAAYCHQGWGGSLLSATPRYLTSAGSFASPTSKDTSAEILHQIHATPRWPSGVTTAVSACASCHNAAACDACHTDGASVRHAAHAASSHTPWTGVVSYGIIGEDQTIPSATLQTNQCSTPACHDLAGSEAREPLLKEDFSHAAYPEYGYPEAHTVTLAGQWRVMRTSAYTGGQQTVSNDPGATLSITFTGQRVGLVGDLDPYRGKAEIWIDGRLYTTIDCYSPVTVRQQLLWTSPSLIEGSHTVVIKVLGTKSASARGTWIAVDAFRAYTSAKPSVAPACQDTCHTDAVSTHPAHPATPGTGVVAIFPDNGHDDAGWGGVRPYFGVNVDCTKCHPSDLYKAHDTQCSTCHGTPYDTLGTWNGTCQQGGCHATYHADVHTAHYPWDDSWDPENNCNTCHGAGFVVDANVACPKCHLTYSTSDVTPPITTSSAAASYNGAAVIDFKVTDSGKSAAATTYYRVDGWTVQRGSRPVVAEPGPHTIQFWSVDQNGNVETPAKSANFRVIEDITPPVTTSNAGTSYWNGATIILSASDASTFGVQKTYYRINGGATKSGRLISIPATPGEFTYSLEFWSVDWSGNVEASTTKTFTVRSGTGTIHLYWGSPPLPTDSSTWTVRRGSRSGPVVASGSGDGALGWDGHAYIGVPISPQPYFIKIGWSTAEEPYDETWIDNVWVTEHGQVVEP